MNLPVVKKALRQTVLALFVFASHGDSAWCDSAAPPRIEFDRIIFENGRALRYQQHRTLYANPEDAGPDEPVAIDERPMLIDPWERLLLVRTEHLFEDRTMELRIFDYDGRLLGKPWRFVGDVVVLKSAGKILLAQQSSHRFVGESLLLGKDGELISKLAQPRDVIRISASDDEEVIWIVSSTYLKGSPATLVDAFDNEGRRLGSQVMTHAGEATVEHGGRRYSISVEEPDFPG